VNQEKVPKTSGAACFFSSRTTVRRGPIGGMFSRWKDRNFLGCAGINVEPCKEQQVLPTNIGMVPARRAGETIPSPRVHPNIPALVPSALRVNKFATLGSALARKRPAFSVSLRDYPNPPPMLKAGFPANSGPRTWGNSPHTSILFERVPPPQEYYVEFGGLEAELESLPFGRGFRKPLPFPRKPFASRRGGVHTWSHPVANSPRSVIPQLCPVSKPR